MMKEVLSSVLCVNDSGAYAARGSPASPASASECAATDSSSTLPLASSTVRPKGSTETATLTVPCGCFQVAVAAPASAEPEGTTVPKVEQCTPRASTPEIPAIATSPVRDRIVTAA